MGRVYKVLSKAAGETRLVSGDYSRLLESGELLTGTPTVAEVGSSDLTLANATVNSSTLTILDNDAVVAGQAVLFTVAGGTAGEVYTVSVTTSTDASLAQTFVDYLTVEVT